MPIIDAGDELVAEVNAMEPDGAFVWLVKIEASPSQTVYLARNTTDVTFLGHTWRAFSLNVPSINEGADGELPTISLSAEDPDGWLAALIRKHDGLSDVPVTVFKVPSSLFSTPTDGGGKLNYLTWIGRVQGNASIQGKSASIEVGGASLMRVFAPQGTITRDGCVYTFKDPETCQYAGAGTVCDKTLDGPSGCLFYNNVINHGGWPGIPKL